MIHVVGWIFRIFFFLSQKLRCQETCQSRENVHSGQGCRIDRSGSKLCQSRQIVGTLPFVKGSKCPLLTCLVGRQIVVRCSEQLKKESANQARPLRIRSRVSDPFQPTELQKTPVWGRGLRVVSQKLDCVCAHVCIPLFRGI